MVLRGGARLSWPIPAIEDFVRDELYPVFADIISWHARGTRYGIKVDASGLLTSGEPGVQLTWMDAKVGDWVVTPRRGKPVEIQALWYNALCIMEDLARKFGDDAGQKRYRNMATVANWSFNRLFWNEKTGCLYDVDERRAPGCIDPPEPDLRRQPAPQHACRPERARSVVEKVQEHLLTPYGLRSLAPERSAISRPLHRWSRGARRCVSPGNGVAVADGTVHYRLREGERRQRGGSPPGSRMALAL